MDEPIFDSFGKHTGGDAQIAENQVVLTVDELEQAALIGIARMASSLRRGQRDYHGSEIKPKHRWANHIDGAQGELAFAKWMGIPWRGDVDTFRLVRDVGRFEVRANADPRGHLFVRPRDKDDDTMYVLVSSEHSPLYTIAGWITGSDARRDEWFRRASKHRDPAWLVPRVALYQPSFLRTVK